MRAAVYLEDRVRVRGKTRTVLRNMLSNLVFLCLSFSLDTGAICTALRPGVFFGTASPIAIGANVHLILRMGFSDHSTRQCISERLCVYFFELSQRSQTYCVTIIMDSIVHGKPHDNTEGAYVVFQSSS